MKQLTDIPKRLWSSKGQETVDQAQRQWFVQRQWFWGLAEAAFCRMSTIFSRTHGTTPLGRCIQRGRSGSGERSRWQRRWYKSSCWGGQILLLMHLWNFVFINQPRKQFLFSTSVFRQNFGDLLLGSFVRSVLCVKCYEQKEESIHRQY